MKHRKRSYLQDILDLNSTMFRNEPSHVVTKSFRQGRTCSIGSLWPSATIPGVGCGYSLPPLFKNNKKSILGTIPIKSRRSTIAKAEQRAPMRIPRRVFVFKIIQRDVTNRNVDNHIY